MKDYKIPVCFVNISGIFVVGVSIIKVSEHRTTRKKQHHTLQTNLMHWEKEPKNKNIHKMSRRQIK